VAPPRVTRGWARLPPVAVISAAALAGVVLSADGSINSAGSSLVATFTQQHVPVDAAFKLFSGTIDYDAAHPEATKAALRVDVGSLELDDADASAELRKPAWFDYARYPNATFRSTSVKRGADGHLDITGTLEIKGHTQTISVAASVQGSGAARAFDGSFELSRKAFGIGDPAWDGVLDDRVRLRFHLLAAGG
jgi:polyisoprenoid-binding protein YceI